MTALKASLRIGTSDGLSSQECHSPESSLVVAHGLASGNVEKSRRYGRRPPVVTSNGDHVNRTGVNTEMGQVDRGMMSMARSYFLGRGVVASGLVPLHHEERRCPIHSAGDEISWCLHKSGGICWLELPGEAGDHDTSPFTTATSFSRILAWCCLILGGAFSSLPGSQRGLRTSDSPIT